MGMVVVVGDCWTDHGVDVGGFEWKKIMILTLRPGGHI